MKRLLGIGIAVLLVLISCTSAPVPKVDYGYPNAGNANDSAIVVKDYITLGIIFVNSSELIDGNGNHTGSKITYEMLMKEAQKLGADDVINIRIDVNEQVEFNLNGLPFKTIYNYTASALAIKYTGAVVTEAYNINTQNIINEDIAVQKMESSPQADSRKLASSQPAGTAKNYMSGELNMGGFGFRYERILNPYFSLGTNIYFQYYGIWTFFNTGIDITSRYYPFKKYLYISADFGFHFMIYEYSYRSYSSGRYQTRYSTEEGIGLAITPGIGCKIEFNNRGKFFMDVGFKTPQIFNLIGNKVYHTTLVPYIGFGGSF